MKTIGYWTTTIIIALAMLSGGVAELMRQPDTIQGMSRLGYPVYFSSILGVWKLLGALALLAPRLPRLKEWAYAGIFFDLTGAAISHAACGENVHIIAPAVLTVLTVFSWALRPQSRRLGILFPAKTPL